MGDRTEKLAREMVRQAALNLPESTFLGWRHFLHELNQFVNKYIRKEPGDPLTFVTFHGEPKEDSAVLEVYTGETEHYKTDPEKLINGIKYFLSEMGIQVLSIKQNSEESDSILVTVSGISTFEEPYHHTQIKNTWMKNALRSGNVIDVRMIGVEIEPGVFRLSEFIPEVEYVDAEDESFIYSIGQDLESGEILAAVDGRFYNNEDYKCIYLK